MAQETRGDSPFSIYYLLGTGLDFLKEKQLLFSERRFPFRCSIGLLRNSASFALVSFGFIAFCTSHSLWTSDREALKCSDAKQPAVDLLMTGDNVLGPLAARFSISTDYCTSID